MSTKSSETGQAGGSGRGAGRCPRWLIVVLVASLTLNLVGLGMVGGGLMSEGRNRERDPDLTRTESWMLRVLPEERRAEGRAAFMADRVPIEEAQRAIVDAAFGVIEALRTDPFSREAFEAALGQRQAAASAQRQIIYDRFAGVLEGLDPDERAQIAARIERWHAKRYPEFARASE